MYHWVCKYGEYPLGHPILKTEHFQEISATNRPYKGLIKCHILPPKDLFHPVLPYRAKGKLTFPSAETAPRSKVLVSANTPMKSGC